VSRPARSGFCIHTNRFCHRVCAAQ
jgi:hypothetical protein